MCEKIMFPGLTSFAYTVWFSIVDRDKKKLFQEKRMLALSAVLNTNLQYAKCSVISPNIPIRLEKNWSLALAVWLYWRYSTAKFAEGLNDLNNSFSFIPVLCVCRCWECSVPAWCCAGGVMTQRMSCWSQQIAMHEGCSQSAKHSENQKERHQTCPQ